MTRKFIGFFRLIEACDGDGCPVCRCLVADGRRHLDALLYEQVNDPDTRRTLRESWGLCSWHTWMLPEVPHYASGAAIVYEDVLRVCMHRIDRLRDRGASRAARLLCWLSRLGASIAAPPRPRLVDRYRERRACLVCLTIRNNEDGYLDAIVEYIDDPQFARAYARSPGLCVPHVVLAIERAAGAAGIASLMRQGLTKWETLRSELQRFTEKHEYRNRMPFTEAEASSVTRVFETLAGAPGVFSHDVRRDSRMRPSTSCAIRQVSAQTDGDAVAFERGKLELRVTELTQQLNDLSSRAAALHDRLAQVAEDRTVLEMNVAGERGANELAMRTITELRRDNERLRRELETARRENETTRASEVTPPPRPRATRPPAAAG